MNAERWQAIGDLFESALLLPVGEQTALLDRACGGDEELRREVRSLLSSHNAAPGGFVQERIKNAVTSFFETSLQGPQPVRVGPYRLIRELGRGGMGAVFLAERDDDEYHASVAIKLVRPGMDTEFILARFRRERQTLARLQHPNISRLLDGGTTDTGLPYIVMEYIDGPWLTQFADDNRLGLKDRLRLFSDVCAAVDYAHRNFIIHRDLKPGNILVDADGVPKLLDFGICKLLRADALSGHETQITPMTPNYASPEQVQGGPMTLLSDVYSLGAVLYELLTGTCPRRFEQLTPQAIDQASRVAIALPSAATADPIVARQLAGDLDNVLMRALETEPERRYESAAQFAEDLRRYLNDEPVRARPQTLRYRALKFVRRNRGKVAALAALFVAMAGGLTVSLYEARIAGSRLQQIRTLANKLVVDVHDAVRDLPGSTRARQIIVRTGLEYLDLSASSAKGDPRAELELAKAYRTLGDVQGNAGEANLGDASSALARYRTALSLLDNVTRRTPGDLEARAERLIVHARIGTVQIHNGHLRDAVATLQEGIRTSASFATTRDTSVLLAMADVYLASSEAKRNLSDFQSSLKDAIECLGLYRQVASVRQEDPDLRHSLAGAYASVGMSESQVGRLEEALAHFRDGVAEMEKLVAAEPRNVSWSRDLMLAYGHVADVLGNPAMQNLGDREAALHVYQQAADIGKRLYIADPADQRAAADFGIVLNRVETAMDDTDLTAKIAVQRESLQVLERAAAMSPGNVSLQTYRSSIDEHLGDSSTAIGDTESARKAYQESAAISEPNMPLGSAASIIVFIRATGKLALNAVARSQRTEALDCARRALRAAESPPAGATPLRAVPRGLSAMGLTYAALLRSPLRSPGDREQALSWLGKSMDAWRASQSEPGFGAPHRREMREVEEALARVQQTR